MDLLTLLLVSILIAYIMLVPVYLLMLIEKEKIIKMIIDSKNPRLRSDMLKKVKDTRKDFILCIFWPLMIAREVNNAFEKEK